MIKIKNAARGVVLASAFLGIGGGIAYAAQPNTSVQSRDDDANSGARTPLLSSASLSVPIFEYDGSAYVASWDQIESMLKNLCTLVGQKSRVSPNDASKAADTECMLRKLVDSLWGAIIVKDESEDDRGQFQKKGSAPPIFLDDSGSYSGFEKKDSFPLRDFTGFYDLNIFKDHVEHIRAFLAAIRYETSRSFRVTVKKSSVNKRKSMASEHGGDYFFMLTELGITDKKVISAGQTAVKKLISKKVIASLPGEDAQSLFERAYTLLKVSEDFPKVGSLLKPLTYEEGKACLSILKEKVPTFELVMREAASLTEGIKRQTKDVQHIEHASRIFIPLLLKILKENFSSQIARGDQYTLEREMVAGLKEEKGNPYYSVAYNTICDKFFPHKKPNLGYEMSEKGFFVLERLVSTVKVLQGTSV